MILIQQNVKNILQIQMFYSLYMEHHDAKKYLLDKYNFDLMKLE